VLRRSERRRRRKEEEEEEDDDEEAAEEEEEEEETTDGAIRARYGAKRERADRGPTAGHGEADRAREAGKEARRHQRTCS